MSGEYSRIAISQQACIDVCLRVCRRDTVYMPLTVSLGAARYAKILYLLPRSAIVLTLSYRLALSWLGVLMTMIFCPKLGQTVSFSVSSNGIWAEAAMAATNSRRSCLPRAKPHRGRTMILWSFSGKFGMRAVLASLMLPLCVICARVACDRLPGERGRCCGDCRSLPGGPSLRCSLRSSFVYVG